MIRAHLATNVDEAVRAINLRGGKITAMLLPPGQLKTLIVYELEHIKRLPVQHLTTLAKKR